MGPSSKLRNLHHAQKIHLGRRPRTEARKRRTLSLRHAWPNQSHLTASQQGSKTLKTHPLKKDAFSLSTHTIPSFHRAPLRDSDHPSTTNYQFTASNVRRHHHRSPHRLRLTRSRPRHEPRDRTRRHLRTRRPQRSRKNLHLQSPHLTAPAHQRHHRHRRQRHRKKPPTRPSQNRLHARPSSRPFRPETLGIPRPLRRITRTQRSRKASTRNRMSRTSRTHRQTRGLLQIPLPRHDPTPRPSKNPPPSSLSPHPRRTSLRHGRPLQSRSQKHPKKSHRRRLYRPHLITHPPRTLRNVRSNRNPLPRRTPRPRPHPRSPLPHDRTPPTTQPHPRLPTQRNLGNLPQHPPSDRIPQNRIPPPHHHHLQRHRSTTPHPHPTGHPKKPPHLSNHRKQKIPRRRPNGSRTFLISNFRSQLFGMNPILQRYIRSNLRTSSLITGALLYGGMSVFIYLLYLGLAENFIPEKSRLHDMNTGIYPFGFLVFLQIFILNFVGTGSVASGMARESIDDVLTYQRLTPLSPTQKIIGYLVGLPIRSIYHFALTLPVTALLIYTAGLPFKTWGPIYLVLFTSTTMFYLLAMTVGFIMGKRFSALISQGLVALLYFVMPQLSTFGFVLFDYLTIRPALFTAFQDSLNQKLLTSPTALFFDYEIPHTTYCVAVQFLLALAFFTILLRRWKSETAHLLSKIQAIVIVAITHIFILGGIWKNTATGAIFDLNVTGSGTGSTAKMILVQQSIDENKQLLAAGILGLYGLITFALGILLQYVYTPQKYEYLAGIRQRIKDGKRPLSITTDSGTSLPTTLIIAGISLAAWLTYSRHLLDASEIQEFVNNASFLPVEIILTGCILAPLLGHGFAMELYGKKLAGTFASFLWLLPIAIALLMSAWKFGENLALVLFGLSPLAMTFSPGYQLDKIHQTSPDQFILGTYAGILIYLTITLIAFYLLKKRHKLFTKASTPVHDPK